MISIAFDLDDTLYSKITPCKQAFLACNIDKSIDFNTFYNIFKIKSEEALQQVNQKKNSWRIKKRSYFKNIWRAKLKKYQRPHS